MRTNDPVLVTGASGYIAGRLIPRLLAAGYPVRCMTRRVSGIASRPWFSQVETVEADATQPHSLPSALEGIHSAYYLIHNMSSGRGYQHDELEGARNFARAAHQAGVTQIIYLGGLADPEDRIASHLRSRIETGAAMREHPVPVTEFRAGVIAGPGSISFEMIRFICEQFPLLIGPIWLRNRSQPISAENVLDYLTAALTNEASRGRVFEIGGPKTYHYYKLMEMYAEERGLKRPMVLIPGLPAALMAVVIDKLTPVPGSIAFPLVDGLRSDSLVKDPAALETFPEIELTPYPQAIQNALDELHPRHLDRIWVRGRQDRRVRHEGFLVESLHRPKNADVSALLADFPGSRIEEEREGFLRIRVREDRRLTCWLEWETLPGEGMLRQTSLIAPKGLTGFLTAWGLRLRLKRYFLRATR